MTLPASTMFQELVVCIAAGEGDEGNWGKRKRVEVEGYEREGNSGEENERVRRESRGGKGQSQRGGGKSVGKEQRDRECRVEGKGPKRREIIQDRGKEKRVKEEGSFQR